MDDDRRIVLILIVAVTATVTGDPWITALVGVVAWVPLRWWRPRRRDTWDATAVHRRRMAAMRRPVRGGSR